MKIYWKRIIAVVAFVAAAMWGCPTSTAAQSIIVEGAACAAPDTKDKDLRKFCLELAKLQAGVEKEKAKASRPSVYGRRMVVGGMAVGGGYYGPTGYNYVGDSRVPTGRSQVDRTRSRVGTAVPRR